MSHWDSLIAPQSVIPRNVPQGELRQPLGSWSEPEEAAPVAAPIAQPAKRRGRPAKPRIPKPTRFQRSLKAQLMAILVNGAMDRNEFREVAEVVRQKGGFADGFAVAHAFNELVKAGYLACEVRLTAAGREKLGALPTDAAAASAAQP